MAAFAPVAQNPLYFSSLLMDGRVEKFLGEGDRTLQVFLEEYVSLVESFDIPTTMPKLFSPYTL